MTITTDNPILTTGKPTVTIDMSAAQKINGWNLGGIVETATTHKQVTAEAQKKFLAFYDLLQKPTTPLRQTWPQTHRMNPDVKREWVTALRSKKFPQTKGKLHDERGYCCLGVLTEIAKRHGIVDRVAWAHMAHAYFYDGQDNFPPPQVCMWAGLDSKDPVVFTNYVAVSLATLNDGGVPFAVIADYIEEQL